MVCVSGAFYLCMCRMCVYVFTCMVFVSVCVFVYVNVLLCMARVSCV